MSVCGRLPGLLTRRLLRHEFSRLLRLHGALFSLAVKPFLLFALPLPLVFLLLLLEGNGLSTENVEGRLGLGEQLFALGVDVLRGRFVRAVDLLAPLFRAVDRELQTLDGVCDLAG